MIETLDDVIEQIADWCGVYGCCGDGGDDEGHSDDCQCRICFTIGLKERIRRAVEVEAKLTMKVAGK